ncbi:LexA family transcriptional regulator [Sinorhizobium mexicanum]|uniref:Helix-turn-helix transcriptional regulator n=1 Tax=Sinorhizobium mexicanum TaxID=375549 RepID=A0A859QU72_9HYPH|nr:helix-turn-helix transcriptional regulator [Sinorhizobium mexicanum]MBP1882502.1 phage repressor protein C with HTH and peptisase S24 domain [Sinorhizobium mexicanum]QLL62181.1 helix-turn-helix transcriptional regulator [Sinorhizobium mexicanum]
MSDKAERLREARRKAGYRFASDAANALGVIASTYRAHENGQNDFELAEAKFYGRRFDVDPYWLLEGDRRTGDRAAPAGTTGVEDPNGTVLAPLVGQGKKIPVFGQAVGGVDGEFLMNGNVLYEVMAPPILSDISDAYAVSVSGDSMSPRYEDGEICFVDPRRPVRRGDYVIAQIRLEENGAPLAYVKKFVRHNTAELVLEQFNPPKELRFDANTVHSVHYIALAGNA